MGLELNIQAAGTVLVIDDDADTSELIKRTLEAHTQFRVVTAASGAEGLRLIEKEKFDVVILDYVMPAMDGAECFRSIKERIPHVPVIFLTGFPEEDREKKQLAFGAFDFITKPIAAKDLVLLITDAHRTCVLIQTLLKKRA